MTLREKGPVSPRSSWRRARGWLPLLGLLFLGWTSSARAEASPRCAVLPLRVPGSGAEEAERLDLLVAADLTTQALEAQGRESCFEEDACLGRVARGTGAQCTVAVALSAFNRQLRVSARVVDGQGAEVAPGLVREVRPQGGQMGSPPVFHAAGTSRPWSPRASVLRYLGQHLRVP